MLKIIVADDEPAGRRAITRLIARSPGLHLAGEASSAAGAIELITRHQPDAAFLDIEMAGGDGFSVISGITWPPKIVFVSAHANYAAKAFDVEAVDFLLKPVQPQRFARTIRRLHELLGPKVTTIQPPSGVLSIPVAGAHRLVPADDILAILAEGDDSQLLLTGNIVLNARRSIGAFAGLLPTPPFERIGRSVILNVACLAGIRTITRDNLRVTLRGHERELQLGRSAGFLLRRKLERF